MATTRTTVSIVTTLLVIISFTLRSGYAGAQTLLPTGRNVIYASGFRPVVREGKITKMTDRFVSPSGTDNGACTSSASPCKTIQYAVDQSADNDTIKVMVGTYNEKIEIEDSISGLTLQGGWQCNQNQCVHIPDPSLTVIDGTGVAGTSIIDIWTQNAETVEVTIENFTIKNGNSQYGAGVRGFSIDGGKTTVNLINNVFADNSATEGGGLQASSNNGQTSLVSKNNIIRGNFAQRGGGMAATSQKKGQVMLTSTNDMISGNSGGGIFARSDNGTTLVGFNSTTISGNSDTGGGSGTWIGSYRFGFTKADIVNSIIWGNGNSDKDEIFLYEDDSLGDSTLEVAVAYSDIGKVTNQDGQAAYTDGGGNISADPAFVNPEAGDYHIQSSSPVFRKGTCGSLLATAGFAATRTPVQSVVPVIIPPDIPAFSYQRTAPYDDFEADLRPGDGALLNQCDMGADQYILLPLPTEPWQGDYPAIFAPVKSSKYDDCRPISHGLFALGEDKVKIRIALGAFPNPVDIYFLIHAPALVPDEIYFVTPGISLVPASQGWAAWKSANTGSIDETPLGEFSVASWPPGTYYLALLVTPVGSTAVYYLWISYFILS